MESIRALTDWPARFYDTARPEWIEGSIMEPLAEFADIVKHNEPLAPYMHLKLGGPAEMLVQPRSFEELSRVVRHCFAHRIGLRVLGCGCNMLIRDEGVSGAVLRLSEPAFTQITVNGKRVRAGTGASVSALISASARHGLAGLETLVGIPGTVGGALRTNAGDRSGDIGQFVSLVEVLDSQGNLQVRDREELRFVEHDSNLDDPVLVTVEFNLETDSSDAIVKRMRKAWILRKATQPANFQAAGRIFKNPRGLNASALIEQASLARTRVGGAEVSDRDSNYIIVHPGATSKDVLRLIDLMRVRVQEQFNIPLEQEITVW
jgi:UDP-N-acetylmuramate dehydrogenase